MSEAEGNEALFARGLSALEGGRPGEAIAAFEALADRGTMDAAASFDRGLAYAARARLVSGAAGTGARPGDLGQAAHAFEEARELSGGGPLAVDAGRALPILRGEVARRRARSGEPVELERGEGLGHSLVAIASEDTWAVLALVASVLFTVALVLRTRGVGRRVRVGAALGLAFAGPALVLFAVLTFGARHERLHVRDAVVVAPSARLLDERGIVLPQGGAVPEGARVRVMESAAALARIEWGGSGAWVQLGTLRFLPR